MIGIIGAICGDIIGSTYDYKTTKNYNFKLLTNLSGITDDTILTLANAKWLLSENLSKDNLINIMHDLGNRYFFSHAGGFKHWLETKSREPYNSYGNGSAMRVSPIGWYAESIEQCLELAKISAEVTHNHPEGIKGAQAVALAIYFNRIGMNREFIKSEIETRFEYDLSRKYEDIKKTYSFQVSCQKSVPEAIICWLESTSYEDCIRKAVSLGGDANTQACIAGAICNADLLNSKMQIKAEDAFNIIKHAKRISNELIDIINEFNKKIEVRVDYPVLVKCKKCGTMEEIYVNPSDWKRFTFGRLPINNCFDYLTEDQKEILKHNLCNNCLRLQKLPNINEII